MSHMYWIALFVGEKCERFTKRHQQFLKLKVFTQPINSATRSTQGAENIGSDLRFYTKPAKTYWTRSVHSKARALQVLRTSLKGLACSVAAVLGIALFMPIAHAPAAQIMPMKSIKQYAKEKTSNQKQWSCLSKLYGKESAWNHLADNPDSTAFGIPQILGMTTTNPYKQIDLGIKYIKHRYDSPCKAWRFHKKHGWY